MSKPVELSQRTKNIIQVGILLAVAVFFYQSYQASDQRCRVINTALIETEKYQAELGKRDDSLLNDPPWSDDKKLAKAMEYSLKMQKALEQCDCDSSDTNPREP